MAQANGLAATAVSQVHWTALRRLGAAFVTAVTVFAAIS